MEQEKITGGMARQAAELRRQLASMTVANQKLEQCVFDETGKSCLAVMNQGICRILRLVGRMELCDRLGGEQPEVRLAPVDLGELTADLGTRMSGLLERAADKVTLTVSAPEHLSACADRKLVQQLLLELVANGAVAGTEVTLTLKQDRDSAVFTVADNGPGVPAEKIPFLFDSGAEELPDWRRGGTGIAIARRIAVLHGGRLVPVCAPGRGLSVSVSIPLNRGRDDELHARPVSWDPGGFDEALVGLSHLLPAGVFAPGEYE